MTHSPNFLEQKRDPAVMVRPRRWLLRFVIVAVLVIVGAVFVVPPMRAGVRAWQFAEQGKAALNTAQELGVALDFSGADDALDEAVTAFRDADKELKSLGIFRRLPWVSKQIRATEEVLAVGDETIGAAREVLAFGNELSSVMREITAARAALNPNLAPTITFHDLTPREKRLILARFQASIPKLETAHSRAEQALKDFQDIFHDIPSKGPLSAAIAPLAAGLPRLRDDLARAIPIAKLLPALAGYPHQKETLILFLNNAELRPGGGFIGTVGRMSVRDAVIESLVTRDAYAIDRPAEAFLSIPPPAPLAEYLGLNRWFMRDANWSPDFSRSAELTTHFYEREVSGGLPIEQIDNVIAFTPSFASELLRITGPILVRSETFHAENLFELLEYQVEQGFREQGIPFDERKGILAELVNETIDALFAVPAARLEEILAAIDKGFREKQLLLYDRDPAVQSEIEAQDWGGRVESGSGDFFKVVDANLGSLKSDPAVKRRIDYSIHPDGDDFFATVNITYRHEGRFDWKTTRYRTYTRLYVPEGSEFISAEGTLADDKTKNPTRAPGEVTVALDPEIPGTVYFGAFTSIEPGEERTLSFTYKLAPQVVRQIASGEYSLTVEKQLGAFDHALTLNLDFGKTGDEPYQVRTDLSVDREFVVKL